MVSSCKWRVTFLRYLWVDREGKNRTCVRKHWRDVVHIYPIFKNKHAGVAHGYKKSLWANPDMVRNSLYTKMKHEIHMRDTASSSSDALLLLIHWFCEHDDSKRYLRAISLETTRHWLQSVFCVLENSQTLQSWQQSLFTKEMIWLKILKKDKRKRQYYLNEKRTNFWPRCHYSVMEFRIDGDSFDYCFSSAGNRVNQLASFSVEVKNSLVWIRAKTNEIFRASSCEANIFRIIGLRSWETTNSSNSSRVIRKT